MEGKAGSIRFLYLPSFSLVSLPPAHPFPVIWSFKHETREREGGGGNVSVPLFDSTRFGCCGFWIQLIDFCLAKCSQMTSKLTKEDKVRFLDRQGDQRNGLRRRWTVAWCCLRMGRTSCSVSSSDHHPRVPAPELLFSAEKKEKYIIHDDLMSINRNESSNSLEEFDGPTYERRDLSRVTIFNGFRYPSYDLRSNEFKA